jgi:catechol 2,3-dioxygenase-like lactoylglutathione lyase family enzyme
MKYLHTMIRVRDVDASLRFFCEGLGLQLKRRDDYPQGKFSLIFLAAAESPDAEIELTWNWPSGSMTSTPPARICKRWATPSIGHHATGIWRSCDRPT